MHGIKNLHITFQKIVFGNPQGTLIRPYLNELKHALFRIESKVFRFDYIR